MASSAKFLEEALSTDVDESAVSAIVGSLENQLGAPSSIVSSQQVSSNTVNQNHLQSGISNGSPASAQKHGPANGRSDTMNIILNSEPNKGITSSSHQIGNISQTLTNSSIQGVVSSSSFINQIPSIVQSSTANLGKTQDGLKTVYTTNQSNTNVVGATRVTNPIQNVGSLLNGNLNVASLPSNTALNVSNSNVQGMVTQTFIRPSNNYHTISPVATEQNKSSGTAVIIKSSTCNNVQSSSVPTQMTTAISLAGPQLNTAVTLARTTTASGAQTIAGTTPQAILSNVQLVNINTLRAPTQQGNNRNVTPRLMVPQMINTRPGQPGVSINLNFIIMM